jgi:hypothetical protein
MVYQELIEKYSIQLIDSHVSPTHEDWSWRKIAVNVTISAWKLSDKERIQFTYYTGGYAPKKDEILQGVLECIKSDIEVACMNWEEASDICPDKLERVEILERATKTYKRFRSLHSDLIRDLMEVEDD